MATQTKKREKTAEEKAAFAEKMAKARAEKKQETEERNEVKEEQCINVDETETKESPAEKETEAQAFTKSDVEKMIADALAKQAEAFQHTQVIRVQADVERVLFLWQAPVADYNVIEFGDNGMYGRITGQVGRFYVPKPELARVLTQANRDHIDRRWLIVLDGLTDDEREAMNCKYKDGEILDKGAFAKLVAIGDDILALYPKLCDSHKLIVAQRYLEAFENGSKYVTRERVLKLNDMSKKDNAKLPEGNPLKRGAFASIIDKMNEQDAK